MAWLCIYFIQIVYLFYTNDEKQLILAIIESWYDQNQTSLKALLKILLKHALNKFIFMYVVLHCGCLAGPTRLLSGKADQGVCCPFEPGSVATCTAVRACDNLRAALGCLRLRETGVGSPFLPVRHIPPRFQHLKMKASSEPLK